MREVKMVLPLRKNNGEKWTQGVIDISNEVLTVFGGVTMISGLGGWSGNQRTEWKGYTLSEAIEKYGLGKDAA